MQNSNPSPEVLISAALHYVEMGYSVLPLIGGDDPEIGKQAAVKWTEYQTRRPRRSEIEDWFDKYGFQGLGIITGQISRRAVLDFDIRRLASRFKERYPKLGETHEVPTSRGCHLYFATSSRDLFPNRKLQGVEFRYEHLYVVAPPTIIDGHEYVAIGKEKPLPLIRSVWWAIREFLDEVEREQKGTVVSISPPSPTSRPSAIGASPHMERGSQTEDGDRASIYKEAIANGALGAEAVRGLYLKRVREEGRNNALFNACLAARDNGWSQVDAENILLNMFVHSAPVTYHRPERLEGRQREGKATIKSAYSRKPRPRRFDTPQLYTSIREALLARGQAPLVRTLEALRLKGIQPGQVFNRGQALVMLAGIVGRDALDAALKSTVDGQPIFTLAPAPPEPPSPQRPANAACSNTTHTELNACVSLTKSGKNRRGKPPKLYTMPDNAALCALLCVARTSSDPLEEADLRSSKAVRQAMHRELIKQRPGRYHVHWLAARLGVDALTLRRYNRQIEHLHSAPTFFATPIRWDSLNEIPKPDYTGPGFFLEDQHGKRYPAIKGVAMKLLARSYRLKLLQQGANTYWYGETAAPPMSAIPPSPRVQTWVEWERISPAPQPQQQMGNDPLKVSFEARVKRLLKVLEPRWEAQQAAQAAEAQKTDAKHGVPTKRLEVTPRPDAEPLRLQPFPIKQADAPPYAVSLRSTTGASPPPKPKVDTRRFWHPLDDPQDEWMAQKIYETVNRLTTNPEHRVSMASARRWADEYGERLARMALARLEQRAYAIKKPAGFVKTVLRSTKKFEEWFGLTHGSPPAGGTSPSPTP